VAVVMLVLAVVSIFAATRALSGLSRQTLRAQRRSNSWLVQLLTGVGKVRVAGAEDRFTGQYIDFVREQVVATARQTAIVGRLSAGFSFVMALGPALFFLTIGATWTGTRPEVSTAGYVAFVSAYSIVFAAVANLSSIVSSIASVGPTLEMVQPILDELPEAATHQDEPGTITGEIELRNVSFRYGEGTPLVLRDVNIHVAAGEMVALVGPSGSGKSSITRLILGFDEAEEGEVFIDGQDLSHLDLDAVRAQFGVVLQDGKIMRGTMQSNILGGAALGEAEAWAAAEAAALADDVRALPMGMMTTVDPANVSGGQAQRILLARALVRQPTVVILDEATSALDNESQARVTEALDALGATRIVIAHRLSTIRNADRIIVIVKGAVVEQGNFDELMAADGDFAALARRQLA
jgi:ABC-type bacteriocin/lantibiotic exporter with double-glycine peptidase domain